MSSVDLVMDMETLNRIVVGMKVPKELQQNYVGLMTYLDENCSVHPDYEKAKNLASSILLRLMDQGL